MNEYNSLNLGTLMQARNDTMCALSKVEDILKEEELQRELQMINELIRSTRHVL